MSLLFLFNQVFVKYRKEVIKSPLRYKVLLLLNRWYWKVRRVFIKSGDMSDVIDEDWGMDCEA